MIVQLCCLGHAWKLAPAGRNTTSVLIDLHTHSFPKSDDSFADVDDLIDNAKAAKLDGICLTDHDFFWSKDEVRDLARRHDFLVLPGSEINTDTGHVLVFGLDRYVFGMHDLTYV